MNEQSTPSLGVRIFAISALILFVEMLLIRWIATEVRIFAYLQNGILVAAFLGLGLGARGASRPARLLPSVVALTLLVLTVRDFFAFGLAERVTQGLTAFQDSPIWYQTDLGEGLSGIGLALGLTIGLLVATALVFHPLGQRLGRWMNVHERPITAYTINILGSLAGIALFDLATLARTSPWTWLVVAACGLIGILRWFEDSPRSRGLAIGLAVVLPALAWQPGGPLTVWSPYQKLALKPNLGTVSPGGEPVRCGHVIEVNSVGYQALVGLSRGYIAAHPEIFAHGSARTSHYLLPHELTGPRERVLVVGAGAGNDVSGALRMGARSVRAVEIDPVIAEWGKRFHPDSPYASERVDLVIEDARAFFAQDDGTYDLIWFGLLDSHTTPSAYANVRLDHYVYTVESFAEMKRLLARDGVVVLFFSPQTYWLAYRLADLMAETFGTPPLALSFREQPCLGWGGLLLLGGSADAVDAMRERAAADPAFPLDLIPVEGWPRQILPTDDWPYLYLRAPGLPRYHLLVGACCLLIAIALRRRLFRAGEEVQVPMLLLGAAFMLLEVTGVSRAALLFGTTWAVNAYVVGAVLGMVLFANLTAARLRPNPLGWPLLGLLLSLLALLVAPLPWLASLLLPMRIVLGGAFFALPVYFSGIAFVSLWAASPRRDLALGSNMLGSLLGGLLSMLTMLVGFQGIGLLTLACYLGVVLSVRRAGHAVPMA